MSANKNYFSTRSRFGGPSPIISIELFYRFGEHIATLSIVAAGVNKKEVPKARSGLKCNLIIILIRFWVSKEKMWDSFVRTKQLSYGQQRGFLRREYFIPGCVGRGLDLDLRVCPSLSPPSGNLGFPPFGIEVEKQGFQTAWDMTGQKFRGVGVKLKEFILTFRDLASHLCQKT